MPYVRKPHPTPGDGWEAQRDAETMARVRQEIRNHPKGDYSLSLPELDAYLRDSERRQMKALGIDV